MTNSRRIKLSASMIDVEEEYTLGQLGLNENATREEVEKALFDILCDYLDWGWSEIEHDQLSKN